MSKESEMMKTGIEIIADERKRQIEVEGWNADHDKEHAIGELANAASCYAMIPALRPATLPPAHWPWLDWWKPSPDNRIKELAKAGALIAAEIDRIQRNDYLSKVEHISPHAPMSQETKEVLNKVVEQAYSRLCQECEKSLATTTYSDLKVCQSCCDRLDREFDEEYR